MRPVRRVLTLIPTLLVLLLTVPASAAEATRSTGPVFDDVGPVFDVEADYLPPITPYKVVFDVWVGPDDTGATNPRLETLARFMNMNARAGVAVEDMRLAVVLHGSAGRAVLDDDAYAERFGGPNPDRPLLEALAGKGVRMLVCGQSAAYRGYRKDEMLAPIRVAVSAYTAILGLQQEGYQLAPSWQ